MSPMISGKLAPLSNPLCIRVVDNAVYTGRLAYLSSLIGYSAPNPNHLTSLGASKHQSNQLQASRPVVRGNILQNTGFVRAKACRAPFFPNLLQHCVSPFKLADATKPGHRKILALFLVAPAIPITSTSNVPPQQKHWWISHAAPVPVL